MFQLQSTCLTIPVVRVSYQGVNAVVFSGFSCAHRVMCDLGKEPTWPVLDAGYSKLLNWVRDSS